MPSGFRLELDQAAIEDLAHDEYAEDLAQEAGDLVAADAAARAPRDTGEGADSIHAEVERDQDGVYADVSWTRERFYMGFKELGTEHEAAKPFLRPALDSTKI